MKRFFSGVIVGILLAISAAVALRIQWERREKRVAVTPTPTPVPAPTAIIVPEKHMDVVKLFSGIKLKTSVETESGRTAETERDDPASYSLDLQLKVRVPKANTELKELAKLNEDLPKVLPWLEASLQNPEASRVSPFYQDFYDLKVGSLNRDLSHLDQLISRQHFFDCETVLELYSKPSDRHALLIQAPMEVDTDGSDTDRVPVVDSNSSTFQPMTSYKWPKKTDKENPFLEGALEHQRKLAQEYARNPSRDLKESLGDANYTVTQLRKSSFLVGAVDPFIVVPGSLMSSVYKRYTPKTGDYCVVIYGETLYPAIIGDAGPSYKIGEASLRICKELDARSNANNRPVSELKVTYLIFPGTADEPFDAPDLDKWHTRCEALLNEMGGYKGELKAWVDLTKPKPTPTPTPSPSPSPSPSASPSVSPAPSGSPSVSPMPQASPSASASATPSPSATPVSSPSASPASPSPAASVSPSPKSGGG